MTAHWRIFLLSLLACSAAQTAVAATAAPTVIKHWLLLLIRDCLIVCQQFTNWHLQAFVESQAI